ncbi:TM0106 family RecB-like putative nuclease [Thermotoga profunda]|uniref:TM0106 family RecB-like putative nuclease n=1 Tax=Thermotoga profunda TaxID=1508420 RepID=UPI0005979360|nr:TM0106 family RecB-like putative nuclease [Thermotoga profunda]
MDEEIWFEDVEQFLICPRRYCLEKEYKNKRGIISEQETREMMKLGFSVEKPILSTELFGLNLVSDPQAVVPDGDKWKIILNKSAKTFKNKYITEAAFHGYIFSSVGYIVSEVIIVSPYFTKRIDWRDGLTRLFALIENLAELRMQDLPEPKPVSQCKTCPHVLDCTGVLVEKQDLLAIHGLSDKTRIKLIEEGVNNLSAIIQIQELKDISKESLEKLKKKALALIEKKEVVLSQYQELPDGIFLDIESHTSRNFDYLFGVLVNDKYIPFLCENEEQEYRVFADTIDFLDQTDGPIYHYCAYEPSRFSSLSERWSDLKPVFSKIKKRFADIYQILSKHVALPLFTYSLKSVARLYGFHWRTNLDGLRASRYFQLWLNTHDELYLKTVLDYNEDDTRAAKVVWERLNLLRNN